MQSVRHVKPLLRQETRQKEIYAEDMYGTSPWAGADPTKGLTGQSIRWQFDPDTNQGVCGDWKVPEDRVPGTPVKVYFVYSMDGGPGGALIEWVLTYVPVELGGDVTGTAVVRAINDSTHGTDILAVTEPISLPESVFDGKRTDDAQNDTDPNNADLYKTIIEYTAYL